MHSGTAFVAVMALALVARGSLALTADATLFSEDADAMPQAVSAQRALMQTGSRPAYYYFSPSPPVCLNSNLPSQIVARVAILQFARRGQTTDARYGVRLYVRALYKTYQEYNRAFGIKLKYSVRNYRSPGVVTNPAQPGKPTQGWFYYYIVLDIGQCGVYKPAFIRALRNIVRKPRPGGSQIKRLRVINY